jgi:NAD(P)-dependent dehydrogenase (short-subunit alcohol dehydrogenase family)
VQVLTFPLLGIGLACAHFLLKSNHKIVAVARSSQPLEKLRNEYPDQVEPLVGDLADFALGQKAVDLAISKWNQLDGLIVNHGVLDPVKRIADSDAQEWRSAFDVNVFSAIAMVRFVLAKMSLLNLTPKTDQSSTSHSACLPLRWEDHPRIVWRGSLSLCYMGSLWRVQSSLEPCSHDARSRRTQCYHHIYQTRYC